jgi:prolyl oligopeptidase
LDFYQQVYFHKIGTPSSADEYAIGKEFPRIAEIALQSSPDGRYILAAVANGDGGEFAHYILGPSGKWKQITNFADKISVAVIGPDSTIYMLSRLDAPRGKIIRLPLEDPELSKATTMVDTSGAAIQQFEPAASKLYVGDLVGGVAQVRIFDHDGTKSGMVPIMMVSSVWHLLHTTGDEILFNSETYVNPVAWYRFTPGMKEPTKTALFAKSPADFSDIQMRREFVKSKDGTKVPMTILLRKGTKLDGKNPTLLTAYGGYGISQTPLFNFTNRLWFDQGGIYSIANIRGGGEYGDDWHLNGNLTKKQNDYDDFYACAKNLIDRGYTSAEHLTIEGGSNGGLLMGVELTQHPELYRAVVSHSGIYDMLRVELAPNGEFNTTEYGSVKNPEQFKALYGYSPYHHVVDGKAYPAALFLSGANDGRVDPANSRKMVARLQAANGSQFPILLRTSSSSGHGIGSALSEIIAEQADVYSFLFDQLGVNYAPIK